MTKLQEIKQFYLCFLLEAVMDKHYVYGEMADKLRLVVGNMEQRLEIFINHYENVIS